MITDFVTGYDHIGIPTNDMEATTKFYEAIGFKMVHEKDNNGATAAMVRGAIDHIALRVSDIDKCYEQVVAGGFNVIEGPNFLPFWENGIKYVCILGPNTEVVEFLQKL